MGLGFGGVGIGVREELQLEAEEDGDAAASRSLLLAIPSDDADPEIKAAGSPPEDRFDIAYVVYFILGAGYLLPWNAFVTAVDYFSFLYPSAPVDRVFSVVYMVTNVAILLAVLWWAHRSSAPLRINSGLAIFVASLLVAPVTDAAWTRGAPGIYAAFDVTVGAVVLAGIGDALVQSGVIGAAGELPERYMQATVAGTAASGVLVSAMRILTKAMYPQDPHGLRKSANVYFSVSIVVMVICVICYNMVGKLPVVEHYKNVKLQAVKEERLTGGSTWGSSLWSTVARVKWLGLANFLLYVVTLSIFPGYLTEDVHSEALKDWYPVLLIAGYNVFDLVGKSLTAVYMLENANVAVASSVMRLLFYPLFLGCLHGPAFFRTEIPVTVLTCLLGLTNGYLTSVLMILAPKTVPIQHAETAGIVMVVFLAIGLATGSIASWFWVI